MVHVHMLASMLQMCCFHVILTNLTCFLPFIAQPNKFLYTRKSLIVHNITTHWVKSILLHTPNTITPSPYIRSDNMMYFCFIQSQGGKLYIINGIGHMPYVMLSVLYKLIPLVDKPSHRLRVSSANVSMSSMFLHFSESTRYLITSLVFSSLLCYLNNLVVFSSQNKCLNLGIIEKYHNIFLGTPFLLPSHGIFL